LAIPSVNSEKLFTTTKKQNQSPETRRPSESIDQTNDEVIMPTKTKNELQMRIF
jgi:hypothetical protein